MRKLGNNPCFYCGRPTRQPKRSRIIPKSRHNGLGNDTTTEDHITPRSRGGNGHPNNIVIACMSCNLDKGALTLEEYRLVVAYQRGLIPATEALRFSGERASRPVEPDSFVEAMIAGALEPEHP